jgi:hypothetical protein
MLEKNESKLALPFAAPAIATAPPRETADLYHLPPEDEDWNEHPEMGNIKEEMHYLHIRPDKGLGKRMTLH